MAIIPLRAYNRDIEGLIDNGQLDEAVAHCRHILATYPKHIATYRLLGKAHLEQQRISDATDIFQRVLSAIPDDFIANVGMSIIREDENNLDASIWHMELAYEAQPSNIAIQDELRRLYGRRDGMQPPKVRLTRGALARMYAKGGLIEQATAELRSAIAEDPNRLDLQLLLADMFFQNSQHVVAVEICAGILKKLPFCLAANQILAVCLPESEESDMRKNYRQVAISMDPYYAFAALEAISSDQVPENAVNIEKLEWKSGVQSAETPAQPAWATSLGIALSKPEEEKLPDWLKEAETPLPDDTAVTSQGSVSPFIWDTQEVEKIITDASEPTDEIPDWMKDAGWEPASDESKPQAEIPGETIPEEELAQEDLAKADMPDWLKGIAPLGVIEEKLDESQPATPDTTLPWLDQQRPGPTDSIIQWLEGKEPDKPASPPLPEVVPIEATDEVPDWLKDLDQPYPPEVQADTGGDLPSTPAFLTESLSEESLPQADEVEPSLQEFLNQVDEVEPTATVPDATPFPQAAESEQIPPALTDDLPDWIKELASEAPVASDKTSIQPELQAEVPAFLGDVPTAETPPASELETKVPPEITAAADLSQIETQVPVEPPLPEVENPIDESSGPAGVAIAAAFLAGLADNEDKKEETPAPVEEHEPEPDAWVKLEAASEAQQIVSETEPETGETPAIAEVEPQPEETSYPQADEVPDWIKGLGETPEIELAAAELESEITPEAEIPQAEELPAWLLDFEQPAEEPPAEAPVPEALEWKEEELPDWIKELSAAAPSETPPVSPEAEPEPVSTGAEIIPPKEETPVEPSLAETAWVPEPEETEEAESILPALASTAAVIRILDSDEKPEEVTQAPPVEEIVTPVAESVDTQVPVMAAGIAGLESEEPAAPPEEFGELPYPEAPETPNVVTTEDQLPNLEDARNAASQGSTQEAAQKYSELIRHNLYLEEVIRDLQDALYRYPVDVNLWVALGDAYIHNDNLKEALSTLSKAEDLVR